MAKRRGNHEGTIGLRKDGRWEARALVNGERRAFYAKTRQQAADKLLAALQASRDGLPLPRERQKVGDFLESWLETAKPTIRPSTFASYGDIVRLHLLPELGKVSLARLTPQQAQGMLSKKLASGLSPRRVQYIRAVLRRALGRALKWSLVSRNVATLVDPPRAPRAEITPLNPEQARRLLEAAKVERLGALYTLAIASGMRQGELLALTWEQLGLEKGLVHVSQSLQRIDGKFCLVEPKTARSHRTLPLPKVATEALRAHKVRQLEERLIVGQSWQDQWGLVFTTALGSPLDGNTVTHSFQKFLARAGLPRIRFHDLRHSAATLLLAQGLSPRAIMEMLGHSQISLTMNTFAHILPAMQQEAAARMDAVFTGG